MTIKTESWGKFTDLFRSCSEQWVSPGLVCAICPVCHYLSVWWLWSQNLLLCHENRTFRGNQPLGWAKQRLFRGFMIILLIDILLSYDDGDMTWQTFCLKNNLCVYCFVHPIFFVFSWAHQGLCSQCKFHVNVKPECRQETSTWQIGYS